MNLNTNTKSATSVNQRWSLLPSRIFDWTLSTIITVNPFQSYFYILLLYCVLDRFIPISPWGGDSQPLWLPVRWFKFSRSLYCFNSNYCFVQDILILLNLKDCLIQDILILLKGRGSRVKYSMAFYHTRCCFRRQSNGIGTWTGFIFLRFALKDYKKLLTFHVTLSR